MYLYFLETFVREEIMSDGRWDVHDNDITDVAKNGVITGTYENNSLPFSEMEKTINKLIQYERIIADMRVIMAKNGIDYNVP